MNSESVSKAFKLIDRRLLSDHSHRGIWDIIEKGKSYLEEVRKKA